MFSINIISIMSGSFYSKFGYIFGEEDVNERLNIVEANLQGKVNGEDSGTVSDNAIVRWDGDSGRDIQDSVITVDDTGKINNQNSSLELATAGITKLTIGSSVSTFNDQVAITDTTVSTSTTTGALVISGGCAIGDDLRVADAIHCSSINVDGNKLYMDSVGGETVLEAGIGNLVMNVNSGAPPKGVVLRQQTTDLLAAKDTGITCSVPVLATNINSIGTGNLNAISTAQGGNSNSGAFTAGSGTTLNGDSGNVSLSSGNSTGNGDSGQINISTGTVGSGTAGNVNVNVGGATKLSITPTLTTTNNLISCSTAPTDNNHLTNKAYVDSVITTPLYYSTTVINIQAAHPSFTNPLNFTFRAIRIGYLVTVSFSLGASQLANNSNNGVLYSSPGGQIPVEYRPIRSTYGDIYINNSSFPAPNDDYKGTIQIQSNGNFEMYYSAGSVFPGNYLAEISMSAGEILAVRESWISYSVEPDGA